MSADLFGQSEQFSGRWPASGSMRSGRSYPLPAPAHPTAGSGCSSSHGLLLTPTAQLAVNGGSQHPGKRKAGGHGPTLADQVEHLLPTPGATDGKGGNQPLGRTREGRPRTIADADLPAAVALLPTPRATDGTKGGPGMRGSSGDLMLPSAVMELLPTPTAADGDRTSEVYPRGNPTLAGALLPTPSAADALGGHLTRGGDRSSELLLGGVVKTLLPTPAAHDSGNTPESHLRKNPGRSRVTSLQVIAEHGLIESGGRLLPTPAVADSRGTRNATARRNDPKPATSTDGWTLADVFWTGDLTGPR
jgi:hypothetical protein